MLLVRQSSGLHYTIISIASLHISSNEQDRVESVPTTRVPFGSSS